MDDVKGRVRSPCIGLRAIWRAQRTQWSRPCQRYGGQTVTSWHPDERGAQYGMNDNHQRAIFVVIEPDASKRAEIADRLQEDDPLQLLFFESSEHARAFLDRMPLDAGVRLEVREMTATGAVDAKQ